MIFLYLLWITISIAVKAKTVCRHIRVYIEHKDEEVRYHILKHLMLIGLLILMEILVFLFEFTSLKEDTLIIKISVLSSFVIFNIYLFRHLNEEVQGWFR